MDNVCVASGAISYLWHNLDWLLFLYMCYQGFPKMQFLVLCCFCYTVNKERFAGLNFSVFRSFHKYHESFSVNIIQAS